MGPSLGHSSYIDKDYQRLLKDAESAVWCACPFQHWKAEDFSLDAPPLS